MTLAMPIESRVDEREQSISQVVNPYRRLFASYSHKDQAIVRQFENYAKGVGDRYVRDVLDLRAGEVWNTRLCELIESADVFQLFWSRNSMDSPFVRQEWEHALRIPKPDFVRPVYWEQPFPTREGLPPEGLARLHFAFVGGGPASDGAADPHQDAVVDRERQLARERAERERAAMREMRARERAEQERRAADARAREAAERARRATEDTSVGLPPLTSSPASPPASRTPPPVPMQSRREHPDAAPRSAAPSSSIVHVLPTLVAILFLAGVLMRFC